MEPKADAFLEYRNLLFSIAYNMLGAVDIAHDMVQDAFLVWMKVEPDSIRYPKAFLVKVVTNACINYMGSGRVLKEKYVGVWLPEPLQNESVGPTAIETYQTLSIGLMVLLERLNPRERAVFLLKEVFSYDYFELAELFEISADNARQILKRAKEHLGREGKRFRVDIQVHARILQNFMRAVREGAVDDLIALLKDDIVLMAEGNANRLPIEGQRLTAVQRPIYGSKKVGKLISTIMPKFYHALPDMRTEVIYVNGYPSILTFTGNKPFGLTIIETDGEKIHNIYIQTNPEKLKHFHPDQ
jgi:RNA polymerase sigma-70 factor, ECF subfamily